jgi:hypothetical protein
MFVAPGTTNIPFFMGARLEEKRRSRKERKAIPDPLIIDASMAHAGQAPRLVGP